MSEDGFNGTLNVEIPQLPPILHPIAAMVEVDVPVEGQWAISVQMKAEGTGGGGQHAVQIIMPLAEGATKLSFAGIMQWVSPLKPPEEDLDAVLEEEAERDTGEWDE